jgi:hypothetical protein
VSYPSGVPAISLADAVRVLTRLRAGSEAVDAILALLQLAAVPAAPAAPGVPPPVPPLPGPEIGLPPAPPPGATPTAREVLRTRPPEPAAQPAADLPIVERDTAESAAPPRRLPTLAEVLADRPTRPAREPTTLLPPGRQRAILSALCSGPAATGAIDVDELVERIAAREPIRTLPQTVVATTRRGVQVLVDYGEGMRPFVADQQEVVRALERLAGPDGFDVLRFAVSPLDPPGAGRGPRWTWRPYRPPLAGQPVVVLSDLGACARYTHRAGIQARWQRFAGLLCEAGSQVVALAPIPVQRYPSALRQVLPILTWDRTTTAAEAVRAARASTSRVAGRSR